MATIKKFFSDAWHWIVAAIAGLLALFLLMRKDHKTPVTDEAEEERKRIEEEYEKKDEELRKQEEEERDRIYREAEEEKSVAVLTIEAETDRVKDDQKKINDYLHDIDEEMR